MLAALLGGLILLGLAVYAGTLMAPSNASKRCSSMPLRPATSGSWRVSG